MSKKTSNILITYYKYHQQIWCRSWYMIDSEWALQLLVKHKFADLLVVFDSLELDSRLVMFEQLFEMLLQYY